MYLCEFEEKYGEYENAELSDLVGQSILRIEGLEKGSDKVDLYTKSGNHYMFYHFRDCCEEVLLEDFEKDDDLEGAFISLAEKAENTASMEYEHYTWTFYKIETSKGGLWMRWDGSSNGYYSEEVDFIRMKK